MANTLLTPTMITREALRVLHEKLTCISTVNRQYDDRFAQSGAKIGTSLQIRKPPKYTVRTGPVIDVQDAEETQVTLPLATQKGVDLTFSSVELTMSIDDFSKRFITPAMAVLASNIEADFLSGTTPTIYNLVGVAGTPGTTLANPMNARRLLNQYLAPKDGSRKIQMGSGAVAAIVPGISGLFHDSVAIKQQYAEGMMGRTSGFDWYENERVHTHTNGATVAGVTTNGAGTEGATALVVNAAANAPTAGSVFTIQDVFAVHPETKVQYPFLQQFTVRAGATTTNIPLSPTIFASGPKKNVNALPQNAKNVTYVGAASTSYAQNLAYHPDFASIAFADLQMPNGVDFAAREVYDGISLRIVRAYNINNDQFPCRVDVLYGYQTLYPELAVRITD